MRRGVRFAAGRLDHLLLSPWRGLVYHLTRSSRSYVVTVIRAARSHAMYPYSDPTATGFLKRQKALPEFRVRIHQEYVRYARLPGSAFTLLDAFTTLAGDTPPVVSSVSWLAFPATARATYDEIDARRLELQDEYVEWRTAGRRNKEAGAALTPPVLG